MLEFLDGGGAGFGAAFDNRLAEADNPSVGVNFEEQPAGFDQEGFELCDGEFFARADELERAAAADGSFTGDARRGGWLLGLAIWQRADGGRARGGAEQRE